MKVNPFSLKRPQVKTLEKIFTDPEHPGQEIKLKLKSLDNAELVQVMEMSEGYIERYLGTSETPAVMVFPPVDNRPIALSRMLIQNAVVVFQMQVADSDEERYTFEDLVAMSVVMPKAWMDIVNAMNELYKKGESKNASLEPTPA